MATVLNPFTQFMGFQPPAFYQGFSFTYPSPIVANSFFLPQHGPMFHQPAPLPPPPPPQPQPQQPAVYPQPAPMMYPPPQPARAYSPPRQPPPPATYAQPPQQAHPTYQPAQAAQPAPPAPQAPAYSHAENASTYSRPQPVPCQIHNPPTYPQLPAPRPQCAIQSKRLSRPSEPVSPPALVRREHSQPPPSSYVQSGTGTLRRREPRVIREVIMLPTPQPIYRQVRHRMPTPERQVITRTVTKKANGDIVVRQQQPTRTQSRLSSTPPRLSSRSRHVHTD